MPIPANAVQENPHYIDIPTREHGHLHLTWDPDDAESVAYAEGEFNRLLTGGHRCFTKAPPEGTRVDAFDVNLEQCVMVAPQVGG